MNRRKSEVKKGKQIGAFEELGRRLDEFGQKTYHLHLAKKIGNVELRKLGGKITQFRKEIEGKEKDIQKLREK